MRESAEVEKIIRQYIGALKEEATSLKDADTKRTPLYGGILLRKGEDGCIYRFETEVELYLCEGTPVSVYAGGKTVSGSVMDASGFDLILNLPTEISPVGAEMSSSPWYLLEDLAAHLEKMIKSSYEAELYADLIERRTQGVSQAAIIAGQEAAIRLPLPVPLRLFGDLPARAKPTLLPKLPTLFIKKAYPRSFYRKATSR